MRLTSTTVERALQELEALIHVGVNEKGFRSGQSYFSLLKGLKGSRVFDVQEAAEACWDMLSVAQREEIEAVAVRM